MHWQEFAEAAERIEGRHWRSRIARRLDGAGGGRALPDDTADGASQVTQPARAEALRVVVLQVGDLDGLDRCVAAITVVAGQDRADGPAVCRRRVEEEQAT